MKSPDARATTGEARKKPTEAELLAWKNLSRDPGLPWDRLPDPRPYVKIGNPSGAPGFGIEIGLKGTF